MQTRAQAKREGVTSKLKTPSIIDININPEQVSKAQKDDVSLTTTRNRCETNETIGKATFFKKNDFYTGSLAHQMLSKVRSLNN